MIDTRGRLNLKGSLVTGTREPKAKSVELPDPIDPIRDAAACFALKIMTRRWNSFCTNRDLKRREWIYLSKLAALVPANPIGTCVQHEIHASAMKPRTARAI